MIRRQPRAPRAADEPRPDILKRALVVAASAAVTIFLVLVWSDLQDAWIVPGTQRRVMVKLSIYWGTWLLWPAMGWLLVQAVLGLRRGKRLFAATATVALLLCAAVTYARFVEPDWLQVRETTLGQQCGIRVALISDLHMGLYRRTPDIQALVDKLNGLQVDAVLVAGDWTFEPSRDLGAVFAPLAGLRHPIYSVMGNHDEESPGPALTDALREALTKRNVKVIDGRHMPIGRCELVGTGDLSAGSARRDLAKLLADPTAVPGERRIVLTHNPDVASLVPPGYAAYTLAGHTHGGQIRLPLVTKHLLETSTKGGYEQGRYTLPNTTLYITPGVGIDILPLRFLVPPTIDVLTL